LQSYNNKVKRGKIKVKSESRKEVVLLKFVLPLPKNTKK
jgi:hypothetical protein